MNSEGGVPFYLPIRDLYLRFPVFRQRGPDLDQAASRRPVAFGTWAELPRPDPRKGKPPVTAGRKAADPKAR
jgi:hypothetical protein